MRRREEGWELEGAERRREGREVCRKGNQGWMKVTIRARDENSEKGSVDEEKKE